jgi:hypothetical protein
MITQHGEQRFLAKVWFLFSNAYITTTQLTENKKKDRQCTYRRNIKARSRNHSCRGKAISITYSECVFVALDIQHAKRMRHLLPVRLYHIFPHYLINGTIFVKNLLNTKCVFWFSLQLLSETFLIPRRTQRDIIINVHRSWCRVPVILVIF